MAARPPGAARHRQRRGEPHGAAHAHGAAGPGGEGSASTPRRRSPPSVPLGEYLARAAKGETGLGTSAAWGAGRGTACRNKMHYDACSTAAQRPGECGGMAIHRASPLQVKRPGRNGVGVGEGAGTRTKDPESGPADAERCLLMPPEWVRRTPRVSNRAFPCVPSPRTGVAAFHRAGVRRRGGEGSRPCPASR